MRTHKNKIIQFSHEIYAIEKDIFSSLFRERRERRSEGRSEGEKKEGKKEGGSKKEEVIRK